MKLSIALTCLIVASVQSNASAFVTPLTGINTPTAVTSSSRLFMEPLASEGDWTAYLDEESTGLVYYFNGQTGESLWEPPTSSFPEVRLSSRKRREARKKQLEYKRAEEAKSQESAGGGFFSSVMSTLAETSEEQAVEEKPQTEQVSSSASSNWLGGIFEDQKAVEQTKPVEEKKTAKKEEAGWFDGIFDDQTKAVETKAVEEKKPAAKEESNWFDGFDGIFDEKKTQGTKVVKEEPLSKEEKVDEPFGLFDIFADSKPVEKVETTKKEEKAPAKVNGDASPGFSLMNVLGSKAAPEKKVPEKKVVKAEEPKKSGLGIVNLFKKSTQDDKASTTTTPKKALELDIATHVLPHPAKVSWGGEDAAFVKGRTFGVFDGVSGAEKLDGVPLYSKTLSDELLSLVDGSKGLNTKELSSTLLEAAEFADKSATGASTAVVASVSEDGYLRAVNLGDSVCLLVRNGQVRAKTRDIVHYFDCPYQLAEDSPDRPSDATKLNIEVLPGDVIVMGSDGVFDNLSEKTICETVESAGPTERSFTLAKRIVDLSRKVSLDKEADTPYAALAKKNGDPEYKSGKGGKLDDISCVVARCS